MCLLLIISPQLQAKEVIGSPAYEEQVGHELRAAGAAIT